MTPAAVSDLPPGERAAADCYFDGDLALFLAFRATCIEQFQVDFSSAAAAITAGDRAALRRIVHSLKSVLLTLGYDGLSASAKELERVVQESDWAEAVSGWHRLEREIVLVFALPPT